jgi:hypothetical protein
VVKRLAPAVEREVHRLHAKRHSLRKIGRMVEHSKHAVMNALGRVPADGVWNPSPARLSLSDREEIPSDGGPDAEFVAPTGRRQCSV